VFLHMHYVVTHRATCILTVPVEGRYRHPLCETEMARWHRQLQVGRSAASEVPSTHLTSTAQA
jgi:hypothetical protein